MTLHDETLVLAAQRGEQAALMKLLAVTRPAIHRLAMTQCPSRDDVDDAVQETLIQVFRRIGALRTAAAFPGWVFSIVRRECRRLFRKTAHWVTLPESLTDGSASTASEIEWRTDLGAAIQALPAKYRQVLILRDVQQYSILETARALRLTSAAVKTRLHRARALVRVALERAPERSIGSVAGSIAEHLAAHSALRPT